MARPSSIDLRERAAAAVLKDGPPRHREAAQSGGAAGTAINWVRRFQETGRVAPGDGRPPESWSSMPSVLGLPPAAFCLHLAASSNCTIVSNALL